MKQRGRRWGAAAGGGAPCAGGRRRKQRAAGELHSGGDARAAPAGVCEVEEKGRQEEAAARELEGGTGGRPSERARSRVPSGLAAEAACAACAAWRVRACVCPGCALVGLCGLLGLG